ncbi:MAG: SDR family NAD(P)-dependent oxidoreductase [Lachnospiraceae bacterium]|uniref:SDR family NAD(P)-dependent oxidoreductase n=1 Tax=uncultured Clostridium sp. TaxID=59620 RepID=UPI002729A7A2|nr:SDR family NAD(P)-dependent oxidoreductase [uncultured Clostridium sp.]MCI8751991.1 SDR family NAD(P)-dependent oxidoreductase [Lachnospiraceae bacterium]
MIRKMIHKLTEYPIDIMDKDTNIELDLGIDSIKKIQLVQNIMDNLSKEQKIELEKSYSFSDIIQLQTIGELEKIFNSLKNGTQIYKEETNLLDINTENMDLVKKILSEISGIEICEIDSDMDFETDLGIDSIKKVQFINTLLDCISSEQKEKISKNVSFEQLLDLKTINEFEQLFLKNTLLIKDMSHIHRQEKYMLNEIVSETELPISYSQYTFLLSYLTVGTMSLVSRVTCKAVMEQKKLNEAWNLLIKQYPSLHAKFEIKKSSLKLSDYKFIYINDEEIDLKVNIYDLQGKNFIEKEKIINEFSNNIINSKFDISTFPLHRFYIFKLDEDKFEVLLANTHLISDGIGNQIILRSFLENYNALLNNRIVTVNISEKLNNYIEEVNKSNEWKADILKNTESTIKYNFPVDNIYKGTQISNIKNETLYLSSADTKILKKFANDYNLSFYNLLVSAYLYSIYNITKDNFITLNLPTSGRLANTFDVNNLVGCFAQNITLTFDMKELNEKELEKFIIYVQDKINVALLNNEDLNQGYWLTKQLINQNLIQNGLLKNEFKEIVNRSIKTNLYISFVGNSEIYKEDETLQTIEYKAYTGTNKDSIDILVEQFDEKMMLSFNYDENAFDIKTIKKIYKKIYQYLMMVRNYFALQKGIKKEQINQKINIKTENKKENEIIKEICSLISSYVHKNIEIDVSASLEAVYGIASMDKLRLLTYIVNKYNVTNTVNIFKAQTIEEIVFEIINGQTICKIPAQIQDKKKEILELLYSPAQMWLLNYFRPPYSWCGYSRFIYNDKLDTEVFYKAVDILIQQHDIFKMCFTKNKNQLLPSFNGKTDVNIKYLKSEVNESSNEYETFIYKLINQEAKQLDLEKGNLFRIYVIVLSDSRFEFIVIGHHMLFDMISDQILFKNLWRNYIDLLAGKTISNLNSKTFSDYIKNVNKEYSENREIIEQYWNNELSGREKTSLPFYNENGSNLEKDKGKLDFQFSREITSQLQKISSDNKGCSFYDILILPLYEIIAKINNMEEVTISHRMHGRYVNKQSYMDTVGNFAVNYPVSININNGNWIKNLKFISNKMKSVPMNGLSYDIYGYNGLKYYPDNKLTIIRVNYLGRIGQKIEENIFEISSDKENQRFTFPDEQRESDIEFIFSIQNEKLCVEIFYPTKCCNENNMKELLSAYINEIEKYIVKEDKRNKVAVITGGSSGIGKMTVEKYIEHGYKVIILSKNKKKQEGLLCAFSEKYGKGIVKGYCVDVTDYFEVKKITEKIFVEYTSVDALVCCAGITKMSKFEELTPKQWNHILDVNLQGTFHVLHTFIPYLKNSKNGSIVVVGSDSSYIGYPLMGAYSASKHALVGMVKTLSQELKVYDININIVCPTLVDTEMAPQIMKDEMLNTSEVADVIYAMTSQLFRAVTGAMIPVEGKKDMYWFGIKQAEQIVPLLN